MSDQTQKAPEDERMEKLLDEWREEKLDLPNSADPVKWERRQFKRLIWRTRFTLVRTVVVAALSFYFLYIVYMIPVSIIYHQSGKADQFLRYAKTLVEMHEPGLLVERKSSGTAKLNGLLTQKAVLKLYRQVGAWQVAAGEAEVQKWLFGDVTYTLHMKEHYLNENKRYGFNLPTDPLQSNGESESANKKRKPDDAAWQRWAKMEDGYVGELGFSTVRTMKPQELIQKLQAYDVQIIGMPVYAGDHSEQPSSTRLRLSLNDGVTTYAASLLNLRPAVKYSEGHSASYMMWIGGAEGMAESERQLAADLEWLIEHGGYAAKEWDIARLSYLKEHGVLVYGAIVTGPVRELEKLKGNPLFTAFQFGPLEPWNWESS